MARPSNKPQLVAAATENYDKLMAFIASMSDRELNTPFDFTADTKKKEAHWRRDKNLRDVLIHLVRWQELLLAWVRNNTAGSAAPFLPASYTWKTYGEMNIRFWEECQHVSPDDALAQFHDCHKQLLELIAAFTNEELFTKSHYYWTGTTLLGSYFISTTSAHYDWALKKLKAHRKNLG
ncbi:MAG: ClbS/DfsB family four-helix bundle protein [Alistipes sp.]|nr:ClbS/DfsB family four-helix bundle protein [Alistipes sp.]